MSIDTSARIPGRAAIPAFHEEGVLQGLVWAGNWLAVCKWSNGQRVYGSFNIFHCRFVFFNCFGGLFVDFAVTGGDFPVSTDEIVRVNVGTTTTTTAAAATTTTTSEQ